MSFEPNHGQSDSAVQFLARGNGYTAFLESNSATLLLSRTDVGGGIEASTPRDKHRTESRQVLRMRLIGGASDAPMRGEKPLPGYVNYMNGGDSSKWRVGLPTFAATAVHGVYPGIDLVYYGTHRKLEYDFVVAPNADPRRIRLAIDGAHPILEPNGELRLRVAGSRRESEVVLQKPNVYQMVAGERRSVGSAFKIDARGRIEFKLAAYDPRTALIIDPVISYASYFGGTGEDEINGSALNASNQLYAVGQTLSAALPSSAGEFQANGNGGVGGHDAFVTKFSADGSTVLWTTFLAGSADDFATGVAVNAADQAYVVGYTYSCLNPGEFNNTPSTAVRFPFTSDAIQPLCSAGYNQPETGESDGGSADAFLVKLSSDGKTELYGTPLGGSQNDFASGIVLDAAGRPYIVGETNSTQYYKCAAVGPHCNDIPSYPVDNHGNADIGPSNYPTTSNAFYSNVAESLQYATTDPNSGNTGGPQDEQAFITVLSADLHSFVYSSLIGGGIIGGCGNGACNTNGIAVAVNAAGQAFIGGNTSSAHWPTTAGAFAATCPNAGNANSQCPMTGWLAGFDSSKSGAASLLFATYMNGTSAGLDSGGNPLYPGGDVYGLAVDSQGNVVVTGDTDADNYPTTAGTLQPACVQFGDGNGNSKRCVSAFITKLSPTGATVWSTYFGPTTQTGNGALVVGNGVALDTKDNVYVVGTSNLATLPLVNPITSNQAQNDDAFVIELSSTGSTELMGTFLGANGNLTVDNNALHIDSGLNVYISGSQAYCTNCTTTFPTTPGAFATTGLGGSADGWVLKLATQRQIPITTLVVSPAAVAPGSSVTFTATVAGVAGLATPTGTVSFNNGTTVLGTGTVSGLGVATLTSTTLAVGTYSVVAVYSGDALYATSSSSAQALTVAAPTPAPTVTLAAAPTSITLGKTSTLTWSSSHATACTASGGWSGSQATSGSVTVTPTAVGTASYVLTCTGTGGSGNATANVSVIAAPPAPTVTIAVAPTSIVLGKSATLTWSSTNATACTASNGWTGSEAGSGTQSVTPSTSGSVSYALTCVGSGGSADASATLTVTTPAPTVTISVSPTAITVGQSASLTWSSTNATACTASGAWTGSEATSGTSSVTPTSAATDTYTLTCTGAGGTANGTASLTVAAPVVTPPGKSGGGAMGLWELVGLSALSALVYRRRGIGVRMAT
jgi:hypothetical protein